MLAIIQYTLLLCLMFVGIFLIKQIPVKAVLVQRMKELGNQEQTMSNHSQK